MGKASFTVVDYQGLEQGRAVTATATKISMGDTAAFSACQVVK